MRLDSIILSITHKLALPASPSPPIMNGQHGTQHQLNPLSAAARLRKLLKEEGILVLPGVYDGLTARIALATGHKAMYMTGAGTAASTLGMPGTSTNLLQIHHVLLLHWTRETSVLRTEPFIL